MWTWSALVPHPPVLIPQVGRGRERKALKTLEGMAGVAELSRRNVPDVLFLLTPHHAMEKGITIIRGKSFHGDLRRFGAPEVGLSLTGETIRVEELSRTLSTSFPVTVLEGEQVALDHASLVPLLFLSRTWGQVPPRLLLANPLGLTLQQAFNAGKLLRDIRFPEKWALVASGDLSHCLSQDAPGGFNPQGAIHDQAAQNALEMSSPAPIFALSTSQVEQAGECGLRSLLVFLGFARGEPIHTLSYEAPFGVGYCTAFWHGEETRKGG